eukprot:s1577_g4.t1
MLFRQREFDCVRTVIFDEVHYLGDEERGSAWEETMILLPAHINLVCLSATVPNCLDLAGWICQTRHSVCHLLLKQARPTPLRTYGLSKETRLLLDDNNVFLNENMEALVPLSDRSQCDNFQDVATNTKLTPTLAFMFSKVHCQTHALALSKRLNQADVVSRLISEFASTDETSKRRILFWSRRKIQRLCPAARLLDLESQQLVEGLIKETLENLPEEDRALEQVTMLAHELLPCGIACHHSGLLSPLRELIERLCAEGLLPMLFCTETCAVGLNLPAKSVAFSFTEKGLVKCAGCVRRPVRAGEYCQMAGRAGRRGCDKKGNVLFCIAEKDTGEDQGDTAKAVKAKAKPKKKLAETAKTLCKEFVRVALSPVEPVASCFVLRFPSMLNLLKFGHAGYVKWLCLQTFQQFQTRRAAATIEQQKTRMAMFRVLEGLGFVSPEQRLTSLGRAAAGLWIGDPLLIAMLLRDKVLEGFPSLEVVSFLSIFVVEPNFFQKNAKDDTDENLLSEKDLQGPEAGQFQENVESLGANFLDCARIVSDAYSKAGLLKTEKVDNKSYFENWRKGCLSLKQFTRLMKDGKDMLLGVSKWLLGSTFADVLKVARVDAGTLAKAIRKLAKLLKEIIQAAVKLEQVDFAQRLSDELSRLQRGLPFLPSLLLGKWESLPTDSEAELQLSWAACPDEIGKIVEIKPSQIGFSHSSCSAHFQDGRTVLSTLTEILAGKVSPADIEELRIYWHQGMYYTLGNRRLCVYRLLEHCRPNTQIRARVVSDAEADAWDWKNKFTSGRWKGAAVLLRHTGEIIGKNGQQSTFVMPCNEEVERVAGLPTNQHNQQGWTSPRSADVQPGAIAYWQQLHAACQEEEWRVEELMAVSQLAGADMTLAAKAKGGPPRKLLDPMKLTDDQLAHMNMDWSPCTDPRFEQPSCGEGNGKPCTRKGCSGVFEKTGEPCQFCHAHAPEDALKRAFVLLQKLTAEPRRQLGDSEVKPATPKAKGHVQPGENVVIFTDFEEAPHQVAWAKTLGERLVRGTEAAALTRESVRHALPETVAKALDGLSPALRLVRAAARAAQRGLWLDASAELRCLWGLSALEPQAVQLALTGAKQSAGRHLGFVIRCASRKILGDEGTSPSSADQEEMLLLALLLTQELGRQRHGMQGRAAAGLEEAPDPVLMKALQPKSFLLTLAVIVHLLDREVVPRDDQICAAAFWQDLASQMLGAVWAIVDQAYGDAPLRLQLANLARATGLSPPSRECDQAKSPLALRAAAVATGSHKAQLAQRLRRPARVPVEGLGPLLASRKDSEVKTSSSWRTRSRDKLHSDDAKGAEDALEQVCTSLEEMEEVSQDLLKSLAFYGAPFLADRLARDFPSCQDHAKRLISQLKGALLEVGSTEDFTASAQVNSRSQFFIMNSINLQRRVRHLPWGPGGSSRSVATARAKRKSEKCEGLGTQRWRCNGLTFYDSLQTRRTKTLTSQMQCLRHHFAFLAQFATGCGILLPLLNCHDSQMQQTRCMVLTWHKSLVAFAKSLDARMFVCINEGWRQ